MGNCCQPESSMEWGGEDWSSLKSIKNTKRKTVTKTRSNKVFDHEGNDHGHGLSLGEVQKEKLLETLQRQRTSPDMDGKVKLKISKKELAELLLGSEIIENNNQIQGGPASSAEQVLLRLIKRANANKPHGPWKPMLDRIPESPN